MAENIINGFIKLNRFCLRFETEEISEKFKVAIDDALGDKALREEASEENELGERIENGPVNESEWSNCTCTDSSETKQFHVELFKFDHSNAKWSSTGLGTVQIGIFPFTGLFG